MTRTMIGNANILSGWFSAALALATPANSASAADGVLNVEVAHTPFQLPFSTEPIGTPEGNPGLHVRVDLSPIIAKRVAILQQTLVFPDGRCNVSVKVLGVSLSPQSTGARVRIEGDFSAKCFHVKASHRSHVDATLLPVVQNHHRVSFVAKDGEVSGELGHIFRSDVQGYVESAVQKSGPVFDAEAVIPQSLGALLPKIDVENVRLSGSAEQWAIDAFLILRPR